MSAPTVGQLVSEWRTISNGFTSYLRALERALESPELFSRESAQAADNINVVKQAISRVGDPDFEGDTSAYGNYLMEKIHELHQLFQLRLAELPG